MTSTASFGSTAASFGSTAASLGSTATSFGSTAASLGSTAASVGSTAASLGSTAASVGSTATSAEPADVDPGDVDPADVEVLAQLIDTKKRGALAQWILLKRKRSEMNELYAEAQLVADDLKGLLDEIMAKRNIVEQLEALHLRKQNDLQNLCNRLERTRCTLRVFASQLAEHEEEFPDASAIPLEIMRHLLGHRQDSLCAAMPPLNLAMQSRDDSSVPLWLWGSSIQPLGVRVHPLHDVDEPFENDDRDHESNNMLNTDQMRSVLLWCQMKDHQRRFDVLLHEVQHAQRDMERTEKQLEGFERVIDEMQSHALTKAKEAKRLLFLAEERRCEMGQQSVSLLNAACEIQALLCRWDALRQEQMKGDHCFTWAETDDADGHHPL